MSKWQPVKLGELYTVHNGLSKERSAFGSGYPFVSFSEVFNNYFLPNELKQLVQSTPQEQESYSIRRGDVLITRTSETMDELGMSCVALRDYPQATYNGFTKRLRPKSPGVVLPEYIGYFLRTPLFREKFIAFSSMTTRASLRNEDLLAMEILLPPIDVQGKIAGILSAYDDLIENNRKQIKLLEEAAQRLYKEWFIDLRFPGHENTPIVNGVPEGWAQKSIGDICKTIGGGTPSTKVKEYYQEGTIKWVTPTDITRNNSIFLLDTEKKITNSGLHNSSAKLLPPFTILMTSRASVGYFGLCEYEVCTNQGFISCIPNQPEARYFLLYNLMNRVEEIRQKAGGATYLEINKTTFRSLSIIYPPEKICMEFTHFLHPTMKRILLHKKILERAIQCRDYLLPKLMNGEIGVK